jgi:hypothetical protein
MSCNVEYELNGLKEVKGFATIVGGTTDIAGRSVSLEFVRYI